jgi:pimeloyl-ACP methyl ester carboxylesterase
MRFVFSWIFLVAGCILASAQDDLPRHGVIGMLVGAADRTKPPGPDNPSLVQRVFEASAAAQSGFQIGDVIRTVDGHPVATPAQFSQAIAHHLAGDAVYVGISRGPQPLTLPAVLKPRPLETSADADVLYRSVVVRGARRRVIVTRPNRPGRLPAVLLMQGLGCQSLDGIDRKSGYGAVISALEERGFVTMRVEKTGEGDSQGPLCTAPEATPDLEAEGYLAGLRALRSYDFVDPQKVFAFAHSMGAVVGSLTIAGEPLRGFIAVETVGTGWFEYDLERSRVQHGLREPPDEVDRSLRQYEVCSHRFYVEKQRPEDLAGVPGCDDMTAPFGLVPYAYMQAVADISLGKQWKGAGFPVLVVYGTASPVTTAHQSRYLAQLINRFRPGTATYAEVPGMGHDLARYESRLDYLDRDPAAPHPFHTGLIDVMMAWIDSLLG